METWILIIIIVGIIWFVISVINGRKENEMRGELLDIKVKSLHHFRTNCLFVL